MAPYASIGEATIPPIPPPHDDQSDRIKDHFRQIRQACGQWPWELAGSYAPEPGDWSQHLTEKLLRVVRMVQDPDVKADLSKLKAFLHSKAGKPRRSDLSGKLTIQDCKDAEAWLSGTRPKKSSARLHRSGHRSGDKNGTSRRETKQGQWAEHSQDNGTADRNAGREVGHNPEEGSGFAPSTKGDGSLLNSMDAGAVGSPTQTPIPRRAAVTGRKRPQDTKAPSARKERKRNETPGRSDHESEGYAFSSPPSISTNRILSNSDKEAEEPGAAMMIGIEHELKAVKRELSIAQPMLTEMMDQLGREERILESIDVEKSEKEVDMANRHRDEAVNKAQSNSTIAQGLRAIIQDHDSDASEWVREALNKYEAEGDRLDEEKETSEEVLHDKQERLERKGKAKRRTQDAIARFQSEVKNYEDRIEKGKTKQEALLLWRNLTKLGHSGLQMLPKEELVTFRKLTEEEVKKQSEAAEAG
ncbi:hypothetical protein ACJ41O_012434 [Fusarium nematophilum]